MSCVYILICILLSTYLLLSNVLLPNAIEYVFFTAPVSESKIEIWDFAIFLSGLNLREVEQRR